MIVNSHKRSYGKGCDVSLFTLGTMRAVGNFNIMYGLVKGAYNSGINHLETAATYGDAEILIGKVLEKLESSENIFKKEWVITTSIT